MSDTISKYFVPKDGSGFSKEGNQSLDDDFKTPKRINTKSNIKLTKKVKEKKSKKGVDKSQLRLTKIVKQNSPREVNPEHWQLAIALSKSLQKPSDEDASCSEYPSTQEKIASLKENLQQFGFKSGPTLEVQKRRPPVEKKKKKSKFQFVTPVLLLRKQEDREQIIADKISLILSENVENCPDYLMISAAKRRKPFSRSLQKQWKSDKKIYDIHGFGLELLKNSDLFYVEVLNLETDKLKCGDLLKDWSNIPGRDISPVRNLCFDDLSFMPSQRDIPIIQKVEKPSKRSITPELFDSDDELFIPPKIPDSPSSKKLSNPEVLENVTNALYSPNISSQMEDLDAISELSVNKVNIDLDTKSSVQKLNFDSGVFADVKDISDSPPLFPNTQLDDTIIQENSYSEILHFTPNNSFKNLTNLSPKNVLIENDNGICVFESFSKDGNEISDSIDLTLTSDEEENKSPVSSKSFTFESPLSVTPKKLTRKSHSFSFGKRTSEKICRSNSLNVTDYVNDLLHKEWKSVGEIDEGTPKLNKSPLKRSFSTSSSTSLGSQKSYYISDEELNYSCRFDEFELHQNLDLSDHEEDMEGNSILTSVPLGEENVFVTPSKVLAHPRVKDLNHETQTRKSLFSSDPDIGTPTNHVIVKTENVTPILNYEELSTPTLHRELSKFGLKPMKRQRGVQILKHLYESTHPFVDSALHGLENSESDKEDTKVVKKRKCEDGKKKSPMSSPAKSSLDQIGKCEEQNIQIVGNSISECDTDFIFEKKRSSKILSCQLPLHIAWYNLVTSQPNLQQNILLYEPIQLEVIYDMLKEQGHVFHIQDIMTFLDKNCVNIKIEQNAGRGYHKRKKK